MHWEVTTKFRCPASQGLEVHTSCWLCGQSLLAVELVWAGQTHTRQPGLWLAGISLPPLLEGPKKLSSALSSATFHLCDLRQASKPFGTSSSLLSSEGFGEDETRS